MFILGTNIRMIISIEMLITTLNLLKGRRVLRGFLICNTPQEVQENPLSWELALSPTENSNAIIC